MRLRIYGLAVGSRRRIVLAEDIKRLECHMKIRWRELVLLIKKDSLQVQMKDEYFPQYRTPSGRMMTGGNGNGIKPDGTNFFDICCCPLTHCFTIFTRDPPYKRTATNGQLEITQTRELPLSISVSELYLKNGISPCLPHSFQKRSIKGLSFTLPFSGAVTTKTDRDDAPSHAQACNK